MERTVFKMKNENGKRVLLQLGGLVLAGLAFAATQVADMLGRKDQEEFLKEEVQKEVYRQLNPPEPDDEEESEEDDETDEE